MSSKTITTFLAKKGPVGLYNRILERRKREHLLFPFTRAGKFMEFLSISVLTFGLVLIIAVRAKKGIT